MPRPRTGETPKRNLRIGDPIWNPALERAQAEGRTLTQVIRDYLVTYGAQSRPDALSVDPWDVVNLVVRELTGSRVGPDTDLPRAAEAAAELLRALGITPTQPASPSADDE
ncbi:hypothetical protein [Thermomonospora cellulosilytica]|uniref:Uncharacterized protein n=1 Tax=Thermomonospora cellulosilytica TaxID=1411118 RepID=A0A7W3N1L3_9ACTN|nr:hypothetical protein [Thermomonospora cellulosilytica]MBA9005861.1 hypothetical protein [Thermomonospora cellulosilytica]